MRWVQKLTPVLMIVFLALWAPGTAYSELSQISTTSLQDATVAPLHSESQGLFTAASEIRTQRIAEASKFPDPFRTIATFTLPIRAWTRGKRILARTAPRPDAAQLSPIDDRGPPASILHTIV
jgi:hypothetical protein